jgi:hypothetical protein
MVLVGRCYLHFLKHRATWVLFAVSMLASRPAAAYYGWGSWTCDAPRSNLPLSTVCPESAIPEGCPIHVVVPHDKPLHGPLELSAVRGRGPYKAAVVNGNKAWAYRPPGHALVLHAQATFETRFSEHYSYMEMMRCDPVEADQEFDRVTVTVSHARAGDIVMLGDSREGVEITRRRECPPARWPTVRFQATSCDRVYTPPIPPLATPPPTVKHPPAVVALQDDGGCGRGAGFVIINELVVAAIGGLVVRRRSPRDAVTRGDIDRVRP